MAERDDRLQVQSAAEVARDLADYLAHNYGSCDRGSDCYHGRNGRGDFNGCLRNGWRGRACASWHPTAATTWDELHALAKNST